MNFFFKLLCCKLDFTKLFFSSGVKGGLSRKDELYNNLIETFFKQHKLDIPKPVLQTEGSYIVQVCAPKRLI